MFMELRLAAIGGDTLSWWLEGKLLTTFVEISLRRNLVSEKAATLKHLEPLRMTHTVLPYLSTVLP